jgi:hypothetical protein
MLRFALHRQGQSSQVSTRCHAMALPRFSAGTANRAGLGSRPTGLNVQPSTDRLKGVLPALNGRASTLGEIPLLTRLLQGWVLFPAAQVHPGLQKDDPGLNYHCSKCGALRLRSKVTTSPVARTWETKRCTSSRLFHFHRRLERAATRTREGRRTG